MNERIKELSMKASDSIPDEVSAEHAMYLFQKKFAELIVRECVDVLIDVLPDIVPEAKDGIHPAWHIKEHFGVEE